MINPSNYHRRPYRQVYGKRRGSRKKSLYERLRIDPQLKQSFSRIGVPGATPFKPDPFQLEALKKVRIYDVLVSAPTGSGKTWIASEAIRQYLMDGMRVWYASPLKALSNSIYQQFQKEFGPDQCGILTGDRKENPGAPVIIGTTEILRNQLYDAMHEGVSIRADLVILDEAHYLSDPDRGVVWEEVLIYLPAEIRLLLLSATISNAEEVCSWLEKNRDTRCRVVRSDERPVPLDMLFLFPDGLISPLGGKKGLSQKVKKFIGNEKGRGKGGGRGRPVYGEIIKCLREFNLLPAIFFLKSRKDCDHALLSCTPSERPLEFKERVKREVRLFLKDSPHLKGNRQLGPLLESLVGAHHAGQLPYWKVLIEKMMNRGYLDAIFSTSTVAAGVNFPARTVVLIQSDRFDGHEFADLKATDLHQMIGRAGRRGKDNIGFALIIPGIHQDPQLLYELRDSPPEPITSRIHINFSMTLNLLLSHEPGDVKLLLERSFASFQEKKSGLMIQRKWDALVELLKRELPEGKCDTGDPYEIIENIKKRAEWRKEAGRLNREVEQERLFNIQKRFLEPGRLFLHKKKGIFVLFHTYMDDNGLICSAHNIQKPVRMKKNRIRLRKIPFDRIKVLFDYRVNLPVEYSLEGLQRIFDTINIEALETLNLKKSEKRDKVGETGLMQKKIEGLPCEGCRHLKDCHMAGNKTLKGILRDFRSLIFRKDGMAGGLWISFKRHLRFLKETGFVDDKDKLTPDGYWATKLRLDHPLLIADAIRGGGFSGVPPEVMAGCIAPFVWDRNQEVELKIEGDVKMKQMESAFKRVLDSIEGIRKLKIKRGFENPEIPSWPGTALFLWAGGVPWEQLLSFIHVDEGDMASLIMRTADNLRQVTSLRETHPGLASVAENAIDLILREPVFI